MMTALADRAGRTGKNGQGDAGRVRFRMERDGGGGNARMGVAPGCASARVAW